MNCDRFGCSPSRGLKQLEMAPLQKGILPQTTTIVIQERRIPGSLIVELLKEKEILQSAPKELYNLVRPEMPKEWHYHA